MAAVELLTSALTAEDVTEKAQKLDDLKQQLDADADGAIAATLDAELPALVWPLGPRAAFVVSVAQLIVPASTSSGAIAPVEIDPKSVK